MISRITSQNRKLAEAALRMIAAEGLAAVTSAKLARITKLTPELVAKIVATPRDILPLLVAYISNEAARLLGRGDPASSPHDRLFEVMMARLDILQTHRAAILNVMDGLRRDPSALPKLIRAQVPALATMLDLAGLTGQGPRRAAMLGGLGAVYLAVLWTWRRDESADMARTMAVLDRQLKRVGKLAALALPVAGPI